jgi:hypothetical protein
MLGIARFARLLNIPRQFTVKIAKFVYVNLTTTVHGPESALEKGTYWSFICF